MTGRFAARSCATREEELAAADGAPEGTEWRDDMFPDLRA